MKNYKFLILFLVFIFLLFNCSEKYKSNSSDEWFKNRVDRLTAPYGWLSLTGFYWLSDSVTTIGTLEKSDFKIESDFAFQDTILLGVDPKIVAYNREAPLLDNVIQRGSVQYYLIERDNKWAVRVKDSMAQTRLYFNTIERFDHDPDLIVHADLEKLEQVRTINIENYLGYIEKQEVSHKLKFNIDGNNFSLFPIDEGDQFFIIFADKTNGSETYPTGRFLYAEKAEDGKIILDFNRSYNPPCAFTEFATCPIPPEENYLDIEINAGEKKYGDQ